MLINEEEMKDIWRRNEEEMKKRWRRNEDEIQKRIWNEEEIMKKWSPYYKLCVTLFFFTSSSFFHMSFTNQTHTVSMNKSVTHIL